MPIETHVAPIFINYRRKISQKDANSVTAALQAHFGAEAVFQDTHLDPGDNWKDIIEDTLAKAKILVALIGREWIECAYEETLPARGWKKGRCRLDNPNDYVRVEIEEALKNGTTIIPVLLDR